jgi:hypothetical protein
MILVFMMMLISDQSGPGQAPPRRALTAERARIDPMRDRSYLRSLTVQLMLLAVALLVCVTVISLVSLWPHGSPRINRQLLGVQKTEAARVVGLTRVQCRGANRPSCDTVAFRVSSGKDKGARGTFAAGQATFGVPFSLGDKIRVYKLPLPTGAVVAGQKVSQWAFSDFERHRPLFTLAFLFALLALAVGRLRGLRAIIGLTVSFLVIFKFVIPAVLDGRSPIGVALTGALAVMLVTIPLVHGLGAKSIAATLGTALSLLATALLASAFTNLAQLRSDHLPTRSRRQHLIARTPARRHGHRRPRRPQRLNRKPSLHRDGAPTCQPTARRRSARPRSTRRRPSYSPTSALRSRS